MASPPNQHAPNIICSNPHHQSQHLFDAHPLCMHHLERGSSYYKPSKSPPPHLHVRPSSLTCQPSRNKSIRYINVGFLDYQLTNNNTINPITCMRRPYVPYTLAQGPFLTVANNFIPTHACNVTKIPPPITLSPYLKINIFSP